MIELLVETDLDSWYGENDSKLFEYDELDIIFFTGKYITVVDIINIYAKQCESSFNKCFNISYN